MTFVLGFVGSKDRSKSFGWQRYEKTRTAMNKIHFECLLTQFFRSDNPCCLLFFANCIDEKKISQNGIPICSASVINIYRTARCAINAAMTRSLKEEKKCIHWRSLATIYCIPPETKLRLNPVAIKVLEYY